MRQDLCDITVILDRSGSMASIQSDTIGGFNSFIAEQKRASGSALLTLVQFDTVYEFVHTAKPIAEVPDLTNTTFIPRGGTALLDAVGRSINEAGARFAAMPEADRPGKVLVVIITDGGENSSREFTRDVVFGMVKKQREQFAWEFIFIGANQDAIGNAQSIGIGAGNAMKFAANAVGTRSSYLSLNSATTRYRAGGSTEFDQKDRDAQHAAGAHA